MKKILCIIILFSFIVTENINSQDINPLDFFPYHVGDVWQYIEYPSGIFRTGQITQIDTVNASTHLIYYDNNETPSEKVLTDSAIVLADPSSWFPLYKLSYPVSSIWIRDTIATSWWVHFKTKDTAEIFNENRAIREYHIYEFVPVGDTSGVPSSVEYLADGIGLYEINWEGGEMILLGCIINGIQYGIIVNVEEQNIQANGIDYNLSNYPNPFNSQTTIRYYIPTSSYINLSIFDILGRKTKEIFKGEELSGYHTKNWIPQNESSGIYLVVLRTEETQLINKIIYLK